MSFWVLDLENGPPRIRGALARWAVEVRAGLYVGTTSAKTRDAIWKIVDHELARESRAVLLFPSSSRPMGFEVRTIGFGRRKIVDCDGLLLARFLPADLVGAVPSPKSLEDRGEGGSESADEPSPFPWEDE